MYIAIKYIGTDYTPGEVLPDDLDEAFVKRLLRSGAIRKSAPDPAVAGPSNQPKKTARDQIGGLHAPDNTETDDEETGGEDSDGEFDGDESEAPEVDVADALVTPPTDVQEETPKPAKKRGTPAAKGGKAK